MEHHRCFVKRIYNETDASSVSENDETLSGVTGRACCWREQRGGGCRDSRGYSLFLESEVERVLMLDIKLPYKGCCDEALFCNHGLSRLCTARFEASLLGIAGLVVAAAVPFIKVLCPFRKGRVTGQSTWRRCAASRAESRND